MVDVFLLKACFGCRASPFRSWLSRSLAKLYTIDYDTTNSQRYHSITQDPTAAHPSGVVYDDIEWKDENHDGDAEDEADGDQLCPVCYTRTNSVTGEVKIKADIAIRVWGNPGSDLKVRASGTICDWEITLSESPTNPTHLDGNHIVATLESDDSLPDWVDLGTVDLNWQFSLDNGLTWHDVGSSSNTAYLTWKDPVLVSPHLYETLLYIGCTAAEFCAGSDDTLVLDDIWEDAFSTLSVHRVDGELLTYYGYRDNNHNGVYDAGDDNFNTPGLCTVPGTTRQITNTTDLLLVGNGQCHAWADLMVDTLLAQGLLYMSGESISIIAVNVKSQYDAFAVKNWATSGADYPKLIIDFDAGVDGSTPTIPNPSNNEAADTAGAPGQGTSPNPPSHFCNHFIVKANGKYYDPSYGLGSFVDLKDYEDVAFAGSITHTGVYPSVLYWLWTLPTSDNDPDTTTDLICTYTTSY